MTTPNRVPSGVPTGGQFAASAKAEADLGLSAAPAADPFTPGADPDGYHRAAIRGVSSWLAINGHRFSDDTAGYPSRQRIVEGLIATGVPAEDDMVENVHARLHTPTFADEDGEHAPQSWSAYDADDRYPGQFVTYAATRDGARMEVTQGGGSSYASPGFSWSAQVGPHSYSGESDTVEEAQRQAINATDYVTSGRAEADYYAEED